MRSLQHSSHTDTSDAVEGTSKPVPKEANYFTPKHDNVTTAIQPMLRPLLEKQRRCVGWHFVRYASLAGSKGEEMEGKRGSRSCVEEPQQLTPFLFSTYFVVEVGGR